MAARSGSLLANLVQRPFVFRLLRLLSCLRVLGQDIEGIHGSHAAFNRICSFTRFVFWCSDAFQALRLGSLLKLQAFTGLNLIHAIIVTCQGSVVFAIYMVQPLMLQNLLS